MSIHIDCEQRIQSLRNRNAKLEEELGKVLAAVDNVILAEEAPTKKALIDALVATGHRHGSYYREITTADFVSIRKGNSFHEMRGDRKASR